MKLRGQTLPADGFDTNVAEKMPRMKKREAPFSHPHEMESPPLSDSFERVSETERSEMVGKGGVYEFSQEKIEPEPNLDVLKLIEDLHSQLLQSAQVKRALEVDLISYQKSIHQLTNENQELKHQLEGMRKEFQKLKELQSESIYLQEENADALEKIKELQQELRQTKETLSKALREKEEAVERIRFLEVQIEQTEVLRIRGKLKEKEALHFHEENRALKSKLEEALSRNLDLEKRYETLRKSFHEVRESLTFLRDTCKANYYSSSEDQESLSEP